MPRVRVVKVKRFATPEERALVCYVGRAAWSWPASRWANPFKPDHPGATDGRREQGVQDCLAKFAARSAAWADSYWDDLWEACRQGELALGCWCYAGPADDGQHACHAAVLGAELNRRYVDAPAEQESPR